MDRDLRYYLEECRKLIEQNLLWGPNDKWKQRDFEQLSDLIFEKTRTRLSLSTIKRIWSGTFSSAPQPATLNALAMFAGFQSWNDFRSSVTHGKELYPETEKHVNLKNRRKTFPGLISILSIMVIAVYIFNSKKQSNTELVTKSADIVREVKFSNKILASGVPNTVVFSFDISKISADSFYFQQTWDYKSRVAIPTGSRNFTSIYYFPGYHTAKLYAGDKIIGENRVHIKTDGWQGVIVPGTARSMPNYFRDTLNDGLLCLPEERLQTTGQTEVSKDFFVRYYNIREFDSISGDAFTLASRVRNDIEHGALTCQDTRFYIYCESGMIIIPLTMPGCVGSLNLVVSDNMIAGRNNDLSALGINLSEWQNISISSFQKTMRVTTGSTSYTAIYTKPLGRIMGVMVEFRGTGALDYFKIQDSTGRFIYTDNF